MIVSATNRNEWINDYSRCNHEYCCRFQKNEKQVCIWQDDLRFSTIFRFRISSRTPFFSMPYLHEYLTKISFFDKYHHGVLFLFSLHPFFPVLSIRPSFHWGGDRNFTACVRRRITGSQRAREGDFILAFCSNKNKNQRHDQQQSITCFWWAIMFHYICHFWFFDRSTNNMINIPKNHL